MEKRKTKEIAITLTQTEVSYLQMFLDCNPCESVCRVESMLQSNMECSSYDDAGVAKCPLQRARDSIYEKLGLCH